MKKYKIGDRIIHANSIVDAVKIMKQTMKDDASEYATIMALIEDEKAAVDAYNVAIRNLEGRIPDDSLAAIKAIRDDENRHIENLMAVLNGDVTQKNLEDSTRDSFYAVSTNNDGRVGEWYVKAESVQSAFNVVKKQPGHQFDKLVSIKQVNESELKRVGARVISDSINN